jgi:hypothetical protein
MGKFVRSARMCMEPFIRTHSFLSGSSQRVPEDADLFLPEQICTRAVGSESAMDCELQV